MKLHSRTHWTIVGAGVLLLALNLATVLRVQAAETGTNDFRISAMGPNGQPGYVALRSEVAYNPTTQQYLVVWEGDEQGDLDPDPAILSVQTEIYGQLVDARTGAEVGADDFVIARMGTLDNGDTDASEPAVVYNSARNEFLVVFAGDDFDETPPLIIDTFEIYAQRVSAAGALVGGQVRVSDMGASDTNGSFDAVVPAVAYNATNDEYLVVWQGDDDTPPLINNELEIFGQRLGFSSGNLVEVGSNDVRLSDMGTDGNGGFDARDPAVAWNSTGNEYLVTWSGNDAAANAFPFRVFGQRVTSSGAEVGTNDFEIGATGDEAFSPAVTYNSTATEFLVVWEGDNGAANEFEIYGQRLSSTGAAVGTDDFQISNAGPAGDGTYAAQTPAIAYNGANDEYLVVWKGDDNFGGLANDEYEVFGKRLSAAGSTVEGPLRLSNMGPNGTANTSTQTPAVAYSSGPVNDYLVVWAAENPPTTAAGEAEIWGQLVATNADLSVTKTVSPSSPAPGDLVQYTITYGNSGPDTTFNLVLTDLVPAQLTGVTFSTSGVTGPAPVLRVGTTFVWDIASLAAGQGGTVVISGTVAGTINGDGSISGAPANGAVVGNTASVATTTVIVDPNAANDSATANFTVDYPPRVVSLNRVDASPTNAASVQFLVTFSEPVAGVASGNFTPVPGGSVTGASITDVTGSGATRTVTVATGTGDGTLGLNMTAATGVTDAGGKVLVGLPFTGQVYEIDKTPPQADIAVTKRDRPDPVLVSTPLTYTVTITNNGPDTAQTVRFTDTLPAGVSFNFATITQGSCAIAFPLLACQPGSMNAGTSVVLTIRVTPNSSGVITNHVVVSAATSDPNPANNSAAEDSTVTVPQADMAVTKRDRPDPVLVSAPLTYTVTITNNGPDTAQTVRITDTLPAGVSFNFATITQGSCAIAFPLLACQLSSMNAGDSVVLTIRVTPDSSGVITNHVVVSAATSDPNTANNSAAEDSTVTVPDTTPPAVTINQAAGQADPTSASPINFTVVFTEPVTGFATGDVTLAGTAGATTATVTESAPNDGTTFTVAVTGLAGNGTVIASIAAGVATDAAGNPNSASASTDNTVTYNATTPTAGIAVTQTVGTDPGVCAATADVAVFKGTTLYYCYTVTNTGAVTWTSHALATSFAGVVFENIPYVLGPGQTANTVALGATISQTVNVSASTVATWTATAGSVSAAQGGVTVAAPAAGIVVTGSTQSEITVVDAGLRVTVTVGRDSGACASTTELTVTISDTVYFCISLQNIGAVTLTEPAIAVPALGIATSLGDVLPPDGSLQLTASRLPQLGPIVVPGPLEVSANVTMRGGEEVLGTLSSASATNATVAAIPTAEDAVDEPEVGIRVFLPALQR